MNCCGSSKAKAFGHCEISQKWSASIFLKFHRTLRTEKYPFKSPSVFEHEKEHRNTFKRVGKILY